jgi:hypothetical protein
MMESQNSSASIKRCCPKFSSSSRSILPLDFSIVALVLMGLLSGFLLLILKIK